MTGISKLTITIKSEQVSLDELSKYLKSLNNLYSNFLKREHPLYHSSYNLVTNEVRKGSFVFDILENVSLNDCLITITFLGQFFIELNEVINIIKNNDIKTILQMIPNIDITIKDLININIGNTINYNYGDKELNTNNNILKKERELLNILKEKNNKEEYKVELEFYKAFNNKLASKGDFGIIREIFNIPKPIEYNSLELRQQIIISGQNPFDYIYNVNVDVTYNNLNEPKSYRITKLNGMYEKGE